MNKFLKILGIIIATLVVIVGCYVAYVFTSYHRIPDKQALRVKTYGEGEANKRVKVGDELKITSYNIGFGAYSPDFDFFMDGGKYSRAFSKAEVEKNVKGAADTIKKENSDFKFFQEVDFDSTRAHKVDERKILANELSKQENLDYVFARNYDSPYLFYPILEPHGQNKSGLVTLSKYKINSASRRQVPVEEGFTKILDLDRCYFKSYIKTENGNDLVLYNLHLSAYTSKAETAQNQLKQLVGDMKKEYKKGNYCIAGGDFNRDLLKKSPEIFGEKRIDGDWTRPMPDGIITSPLKLVAPYSKETHAASCRDSGVKYDKNTFVITLDGFVVSDNIEVLKSDVINVEFEYSDHNPVYMNFKLK